MKEKHRFLTRKGALALILLCGAVLLALILGRWQKGPRYDMSSLEDRSRFLMELGWEIDPDSESVREVLIPEKLEGAMEEYNKMQLEQGYDLSKHPGERCRQYTYSLKNYPGDSGTVLVSIYVQGRELIAGDIHSTSINGFMHGIKRAET